ncbi:dienelactone hydrolase family protein [Microbaculum marinum]|uniref:Dienelactone hydrolase family protein n=1 Tax=Microbaculum marinum TaxID=1764581 RepID=A0AAW9RX48_9HYPH
MGQMTTLTAADGFELGAYRAEPEGSPRGGLVVVQEIFGVNSHIRSICDRYAALGYATIAPAVFDRIQPGFECGYSPEEVAEARKFIGMADFDDMLRDTQAAIDALAGAGKIGLVGYCLGGSIAFLAAARLTGLSAAVGYYGSKVATNADETPKVPTQMHFGEQDQGIPMSDVETVIARRPDVDVHVYPAGHGFACDERASFDAASTMIATGRTLRWFDEHLAG